LEETDDKETIFCLGTDGSFRKLRRVQQTVVWDGSMNYRTQALGWSGWEAQRLTDLDQFMADFDFEGSVTAEAHGIWRERTEVVGDMDFYLERGDDPYMRRLYPKGIGLYLALKQLAGDDVLQRPAAAKPAKAGLWEFLDGEAGAASDATRSEIVAPVAGKVLPLAQVADRVFASGALGPGVGINPTSGVIVAPVSGEVIVAVGTGHAFGIRTEDGIEVLVHIGIDTVEMNGQGFTGAVSRGTHIRAGQTLVTADLNTIAAAGHPSTVILVVTNVAAFSSVDHLKINSRVVAGEPILTVAQASG
jgi:glucose-specific phosphotransferase system IIA component